MSLNIATELVAHVAAYLSGREAGAPGGGSYWGRGKKSELLALRVASKHCRDAVRRAVKTHASCEVISLAPVDSDGYSDGTYYRPECVAAAGRVFGAGCREVYFQGNTVALESAFEEFVKNTEGRLRILTNKFDSDLLDTIYEVGDLLEERGGGMGLMIGRRAD
jgi:hypothetical protein